MTITTRQMQIIAIESIIRKHFCKRTNRAYRYMLREAFEVRTEAREELKRGQKC